MMRGARVSGGFSRSRGWRLFPRRRAMDRAAIGKWNIVWQLVSCRKVRRNVSAVGGMKTKVGSALVRIEYQNPLFEFVTNEIKRSNKVCIAADVFLEVWRGMDVACSAA